AKVPIVPAAVIFDLNLGDPAARPDAAMGYAACQAATDGPVAEGNVGAGTGASAGKLLGISRAMKTGLGSAAVRLGDDLVVAALMVVNPFGNVVDPRSGQILAGVRPPEIERPTDMLVLLQFFYEQGLLRPAPATNTVIGVVATNARLSKEQVNKIAQMAQDGIARAIRPAHTMFDGDTLFALATGETPADVSVVGAFAAEVVAQAIARAAKAAESAGGLPAYRDLFGKSGEIG
ncbi:MAG: P1 family peptidase, partial [Anaerolineae bacterium]